MRSAITKKQLLEALEGLDDDTQIFVLCTSLDLPGGEYAHDMYFDDKVTGNNLQNEITLIAHF